MMTLIMTTILIVMRELNNVMIIMMRMILITNLVMMMSIVMMMMIADKTHPWQAPVIPHPLTTQQKTVLTGRQTQGYTRFTSETLAFRISITMMMMMMRIVMKIMLMVMMVYWGPYAVVLPMMRGIRHMLKLKSDTQTSTNKKCN